ncbi:hypothetical protein BJ944DRAFT_232630 [Cunninghamella echinulata]|nr:hypothetical protein BJ944DRAFT_232630 [Cunninghamella echinulata]
MSPMTMPVNTYHTPTQHPTNNNDYQEEEEYFTPLISPAIPPNYYTNLRCDTNFSPLTSPALGPQHQVSMSHHSLQVKTDYSTLATNIQEGQSPEELQERLAMIERQQQQLLSGMGSPTATTSTNTTTTTTPSSSSPSINNNNNNNKISAFGNNSNNSTIGKSKQSLRHKIAMSSPQFNATVYSRSPGLYPVKNNNNNNNSHPHATSSINNQILAPATPSLLMKLGNGTHNNTIGSNSNDHSLHNSPMLNPSISLSSQDSSAVDNIMVLPDAILPPSSSSPSSNINNNNHENHHHHHHRKASNSSSVTSPSSFKRRRISHPRSAFTPPALLPSSPQSFRHSGSGIDQGIAALVSPAALRPHHHHHQQHHPSLPSPSSSSSSSSSSSNVLVQNMITSSPRALKPLISPSLQPNGKRLSTIDEQEAANILATKSNYQALREGKAKSLGIEFNTNIQSGMENRRSAHKAAEQRRRDTLKQSFDSLRAELLEALVAEDELICILDNHPSTSTSPNNNKKQQQQETDDNNNNPPIQKSKEEIILERQKKIKQMSKVVLLQHSYEYMLRLKLENKRKDDKMAKMTQEIQSLRSKLGMELITEEERQADIEEKRQENEKRIERLKRLEDITDS